MNNENATIILFSVLFLTVLTVIIVKLAVFFTAFNKDTRFISMELSRAYSDDEYRFWRRELRCHYLTLLPFVNERNVIDIYKQLYHKPKHFAEKKRIDGLYHMLAPSLVGLVLCCVCLCGVSWAWFSASQSTEITKIESARFTVTATATDGISSAACTTDDKGIHTIALEKNKEYTVTLTPSGNASKGFCVLEMKSGSVSDIKYTEQLTPNSTFEFKVRTGYDGTSLLVTPQWGTCSSSSSSNIITNNHPCVWGLYEQNTTVDQNSSETFSQVTPSIPTVSSPAPEAPVTEPTPDTTDTTPADTTPPETESDTTDTTDTATVATTD